MSTTIDPDKITIRPANEASWEDLLAVFGKTGYASRCLCQAFKTQGWHWAELGHDARVERLQAQTNCGDPDAETTSGIVAYLDGEPVGWCAVEPRTAYLRFFSGRSPVHWTGRDEDKEDDTVWAATCFVTRKEYRHRGVMYELAKGAVEFARSRGAKALEAYGMRTEPGKEITWGELHVGSVNALADAGLVEVSHPTKRRVVMRIDF